MRLTGQNILISSLRIRSNCEVCLSTLMSPNLVRGIFFIVQVSLTQARIDMSELDEDGDGFLQPQVTHFAARSYLAMKNLPSSFGM